MTLDKPFLTKTLLKFNYMVNSGFLQPPLEAYGIYFLMTEATLEKGGTD